MDQKNDFNRHSEDQGVLAMSVDSAALASEKTLGAWFGLLRDVRGEVAQRTVAVIDWVDGTQQGATRIARTLVQRTDEVAVAWLDAHERLALGIVRAFRTTGHGASRLVSRTAASLTSTRTEVVGQA